MPIAAFVPSGNQRVMVAITAAFVGFVVFFSVGLRYINNRSDDELSHEDANLSILVAKQSIQMGEIIKAPEDLFEVKLLPLNEETKAAIVEFDKIKDRRVKRSLRRGEFVTSNDLIDPGSYGMHRTRLPQGCQAMGIRVTPESIVGDFASLPHTRITLIWTEERAEDGTASS